MPHKDYCILYLLISGSRDTFYAFYVFTFIIYCVYNVFMRINNVLVRVKHELGSKFPRNSEDKTRDPGGRMLISVYILLESKIKKKQYLAYVNVPSKLPINQIREYQEYCLRKLRKSSLEHYLNAKIYPEVLVRRAFTKNFGLVPKNELSDERHFIL